MNTAVQETLTEQTPFRFYLRKLKEHFQHKVSPFYSPELDEKLSSWAIKIGKLNHEKAKTEIAGSNLCLLVAACYPEIVSYEKYKIICENYFLQVIIDDHMDEEWGKFSMGESNTDVKKYLSRVLRAFNLLDVNTPWYKKWVFKMILTIPGILPIWIRSGLKNFKQILDELNPSQQNRLIEAYTDYLKSAVDLAAQPQEVQAVFSDVDSYMEKRLKNVDAKASFILVEYANNISLTDEEYHHPVIQQLITTAIKHSIYFNDLISSLKEYKGKLADLDSLIGILMRSKEWSVQQAVDELCLQIETAEITFIEIRDNWYAGSEIISDNSRNFIRGIQDLMAGHMYWSRRAKRYFGRDFNGAVTQGYLEWHPDGPRYIPGNI